MCSVWGHGSASSTRAQRRQQCASAVAATVLSGGVYRHVRRCNRIGPRLSSWSVLLRLNLPALLKEGVEISSLIGSEHDVESIVAWHGGKKLESRRRRSTVLDELLLLT